jgi:hypothetical protein
MTKKLVIPSENQEQKALVTWLSYHPIVRDFFCKNNNEGKRTVAQGHNLKLMGLRPGVSDLFIYYPTTTYHGLFLEVKRNKKYTKSERLTDTWIAQEKFIETVKSVGYQGHWCYGWEDGKKIIEAYLLT